MSNIHKEFGKYKHKKLTIESRNINNLDEISYAYIIDNNKKYDYTLMKCEFKIVFKDNQKCSNVTSELCSKKTM